MSYSKAQIEAFMRIGQRREEFFLKWAGRDSFFDDGVQGVLSALHPSKNDYASDLDKAFAIDLWSTADTFARTGPQSAWNDLFRFQIDTPHSILVSMLVLALHGFYSSEDLPESAPKGQPMKDTITKARQWRTSRWLFENPRHALSHEECVRLNTLLKRQIEKNPKAKALPVSTSEKLKLAREWFDGKHPTSPGATRTAIAKENARRDKVMRHWAECWLAHLGQEGVTKSAPKK